jgi:peptide/nickel transport system permease protein
MTPARRLVSKRARLLIGLGMIASMGLVALLAPWLASHGPMDLRLELRLQGPSGVHWFGLDQNGADVFSHIVWGARLSLRVALTVVTVSALIGLLVGSIAGFFGGWLDNIIMRLIDMIYAFPGFLLALALVAVLGPSINNLIIAMCLTTWTGFARLVRGEVLHLKTREYVIGALAVGANSTRQLVVHIWPNLIGLVIVQMTFATAGTIMTESGLSFLGLGAPATTPTWGSLLNSGRRVLIEAPHISIFPGLAILWLVLGFNLTGDGLRDWLNPKRDS